MYYQALTIAGSDSGGGAGIQADLKAFSALQVYGASVITAVTAQNTTSVLGVENISPQMIALQIQAVLNDLNIGAIKIGMLGNANTIAAVAITLANIHIPIVLDPVMIAKSGDELLCNNSISALCQQLLPRTTLLTPNLPEAARLLGTTEATSIEEKIAQGNALLAYGPAAVLMKDGHGYGDICTDVLVLPERHYTYAAPRLATTNTHGTGCTLSAAIAAELAKQAPLPQAVRTAHHYLHGAIKTADNLHVGGGHGPVHHFYRQWPNPTTKHTPTHAIQQEVSQ